MRTSKYLQRGITLGGAVENRKHDSWEAAGVVLRSCERIVGVCSHTAPTHHVVGEHFDISVRGIDHVCDYARSDQLCIVLSLALNRHLMKAHSELETRIDILTRRDTGSGCETER